jgi:integrase
MAKRSHGEGSVRRRPDGRWEARIRLPNGRRASAYGKTRKEAVRELDQVRRRLALGRPIQTTRETVCSFLTTWLDSVERGECGGRERPLRERSARRYRDAVRHLEHHLCHPAAADRHREVSTIKPNDARALVSALGEAGVGVRTRQIALTLARRAWDHAEREGYARANVFADVRGPVLEEKPLRVLDREELARLLATAEGSRLEPFVVLLVGTGLRLGEALGLRWRDVNLREGFLRVAQAQVENGGEILFREPKTAHSRRTVRLPASVVAALTRHRNSLSVTPLGERLVFADALGRPFRRSNILRREWHPLLERSKLPRVGFHVLRHTFASHALGAGVDARTVADQLGHRDPSVTWDRYAKTVAVGRERLTAAVDELLTPKLTPKRAPAGSA